VTIPLQNSVVYGPVVSRRLGRSLGLNILPADIKFCLSDCIYCQYGRTDFSKMKGAKLPPKAVLLEEIEKELARLSAEGNRLDSITFSGNGEPTLHPDFPRLVEEVKNLRDLYYPGVPVSALCDSTQIHRQEIREALAKLDVRYMKLDAGDEETYRMLNHAVAKINWEQRVSNLGKISEITLQSLFICAPVDNTADPHLRRWMDAVGKIAPREVHLYTIARSTADPAIRPASRKRLEEISRSLRERTGICATVFG
jgi:wyosine [tRNA(Phe)-imidazoG37] synthetase (radical SAM superfamily)